MRARFDTHRHPSGVLTGVYVIHLQQVAVPLVDHVDSQARNRVAQIEIDPVVQRTDAVTVFDLQSVGPRGDIARDEVAERGVAALQEVVPLALGDVVGGTVVTLLLGHPDPGVVAQRLTHQHPLGLHVGIPAGGQHHGVGGVGPDRPGDHVAGDNAAGHTVGDDQIQHLVAGVQANAALGDLAMQRPGGGKLQLLAGLPARVVGPGHLHATKRSGRQLAAVLAGERGGDAVRAARAVVIGEALDLVAKLAQGGRAAGAGQPTPDDDDTELAPVQRGHQPVGHFSPVPRGGRVTVGHPAVHRRADNAQLIKQKTGHDTTPLSTAIGSEMLPTITASATTPATATDTCRRR
jgi:hypothetical protein